MHSLMGAGKPVTRPFDWMKSRPSNGVIGESVRFYLPALDGLRFIAFLLVLIHHLEAPPPAMNSIKTHGWVGVELFFAISGFLFFSLLRLEDREKGDISIPNFYVRRLLRLYPLMVAFPILMLICFGPQSPLGALWVAACGARLAFILVGAKHPVIWVTPFLRPESTFVGLALGIGLLTRVPAWVMAALGVATFFAFLAMPAVGKISLWTMALYPICGVLCGAVLWLGVNTRYGTLLLSRPWLVFLGKISFGLYVFHLLAIWLGRTTLHSLQIPVTREHWNYGLRFALSLAFAIGMSTLSYFLFERFFLRAKLRFSAIESRPI
jgi:peptidoglycan/LPS O-acetylase OafA/YrhL